MKYKQVPLKKLVSFLSKGITPKYTDKLNYNSIVVLNQKCNRDGKINFSKSRINDLNKRKVPNERILKNNDIIINSTGTGTAGRVAQIFEINKPVTIDSHMIIIRSNENVNPIYMGYALKAQQEKIESLAEGSTGQTEINKKRLVEEIKIPFYSLSEQNKIADKLITIDNKIELNNKINANLAYLETLIFDNWLASTESKNKLSLDEIASYKNGLAMQKFRPIDYKNSLPVLKIKELNQGHTDDKSDRCSIDINEEVKVKTGDIIFSWSGTLLLDIWSGKNAGLNQHLFKVTSEKFPDWFIFEWTKYYLREFQNIAKSKATTMGHIKRTELKKSMAIIPTDFEMNNLNKILKPIFSKQITIKREINELVDIKNELLSKLLN